MFISLLFSQKFLLYGIYGLEIFPANFHLEYSCLQMFNDCLTLGDAFHPDLIVCSFMENSIDVKIVYLTSGPEVIKLFPCSTQLCTKFILLINVKMPTILTFISMVNTTSERLKARNFFICQYFSFYEQLKFRAQLS